MAPSIKTIATKTTTTKPQTKTWDPKKKESNWIRQYVKGSYGLNVRICGMKKDRDIWTPKHVEQFNAFMKKSQQLVSKPIKVYRGTGSPSPTMQHSTDKHTHWDKPIKNCQYLSTSKNKYIGMRFAELQAKEKGFLHLMHLHKGVKIYDVSAYPTDKEPSDDVIGNVIKQEQEVIIYPKQYFSFIGTKRTKKGSIIFEWDVTPTKPQI